MDDFTNDRLTTGRFSVDAGVVGAIETDGDTDWLGVELEAGKRYQFNAPDNIVTWLGSVGWSFNFGITGVYDDAGAPALDGYDYPGFNTLDFTPQVSGLYFVEISQEWSAEYTIDEYYLSVVELGPTTDLPANRQTTGVIDIDGSTQGVIDQVGDLDWFRVPLEVGKRYTFQVTKSDDWISPEELSPDDKSRPYIGWLRDSNGSFSDLGEGITEQFVVRPDTVSFIVEETGDYFLWVGAFINSDDHTIGSYVIDVEVENLDDFSQTTVGSGTLAVGGTATGSIDHNHVGEAADVDWFAVELREGTLYRFDLDASSLHGSAFGGIYDSREDAIIPSLDSADYPTAGTQTLYYIMEGGFDGSVPTTETIYVAATTAAPKSLGDYTLSASVVMDPVALSYRDGDRFEMITARGVLREGSTEGTTGNDLISGGTAPGTYWMRGGGGEDILIGGQTQDVIVADGKDVDVDLFYVDIIHRAYQAIFGRAPEANVVEDRAEAAIVNPDVFSYRLAHTLLDSEEYKLLSGEPFFGSGSAEAFVDRLYEALRGPNAATDTEVATKVAWLERRGDDSGDRTEMALQFMQSQELKNKMGLRHLDEFLGVETMGTPEPVTLAYRALFEREVDDSGRATWSTFLDNGNSLQDLAASLLSSAEGARLDALSDEDFMQAVFRAVSPGASTLDALPELLARGRVDWFADQLVEAPAKLKAVNLSGGTDDILMPGRGDSTLYGGQGSDIFVFTPTDAGTHRIRDLDAWDRIDLTAFDYVDAAAAIDAFDTVSNSVRLVDGDVTILIARTGLNDLTEDMFVI